ncbi:MAG TPA: T9SS type A sorting domain-containing protein [Rhodothermales bacterium]|nr:T9SS type A sorting domain-containing protein [Rhodothermales bacterium]
MAPSMATTNEPVEPATTRGGRAWTYNLQGQTFDVGVVPDADGDGVEDVAATGRFGRTVLLSGATGTQLWSHTFGNDTFDQSGEVVAALPDLDGNGAPEVVFGTRDGRVVLLYGGEGGTTAGEPGAPVTALALAAPAPNPVRGATTLAYALPEAADVALALYDALGRRVWHHDAPARPAGRHAVTLDAGALAAGVYVLRLDAAGESRTQRLVVAR